MAFQKSAGCHDRVDKRMSWNGKGCGLSLPFQIKKFGLRNPGYPQIPKRFLLQKCALQNQEIEPPSRKINCFLAGAVAVYAIIKGY